MAAAVYVSRDGMPPGQRSLEVYLRVAPGNAPFRQIPTIDRNIDPMSYPLMFSHGESGWHVNIDYDIRRATRSSVSMMEFYVKRLSVRASFCTILASVKLTQQYIIDAWIKFEGQRLNWVRMNQKDLRGELYSGLMDHVNNCE